MIADRYFMFDLLGNCCFRMAPGETCCCAEHNISCFSQEDLSFKVWVCLRCIFEGLRRVIDEQMRCFM